MDFAHILVGTFGAELFFFWQFEKLKSDSASYLKSGSLELLLCIDFI